LGRALTNITGKNASDIFYETHPMTLLTKGRIKHFSPLVATSVLLFKHNKIKTFQISFLAREKALGDHNQ
jgi:hypothetical protein